MSHKTCSSIRLLSFAALGSFLFGYTTAIISGALLFLKTQFSPTLFQEGLIVSGILLGALFGAISAGKVADTIGRKKAILITALLFILGTIICSLAQNIPIFISGRFIAGIAVGLTSVITPLYLTEFAPVNKRGAFVSVHQLSITVGILCAFLVNYAFAFSGNWRAMFALALVPSVVQFLGMLFLPESPAWKKGELKSKKWKELWTPRIKKALVIGLGLNIFQQITGINVVIYYAPLIFQMAEFASAKTAIFASIGIGAINVIATFLSLWMLDKLGRVPLLLIGLSGMAISLFVVSWGFFTESPLIDRLAMVGLISYVACFAIGIGVTTALIISEIYPVHVRAKAMSLATLSNWLFNFIVAFTFPYLFNAFNAAGSFCLYGAICLLALAFIYFYVPETKGKTFDQIQDLL